MAFYLYSNTGGHVPSISYLPCSAITPKMGMAMVQSSGNLAAASGTNKPTYICMTERKSACTAGDLIPVIRVSSDMVFDTTASAALTSVNLGDKVTLSADGMQVTATTTGGIAEIVWQEAQTEGSHVHVRF